MTRKIWIFIRLFVSLLRKQPAIEELASPNSNGRHISRWQRELLISTLLLRDIPQHALRAMRADKTDVDPQLVIRTLLANNMVTEAFNLQRTKRDERLLMSFFKSCHDLKKWGPVMRLSLTEKESDILGQFLRTVDLFLTGDLQFVYLLQRNKCIEALTYLQKAKHHEKTTKVHHQSQSAKPKQKQQNMIASAFKMALAPSEQKMSDVYLPLKENVESVSNAKADNNGGHSDDVSPLSRDMNQKYLVNKQSVFGGLFHRALIGSKDATNYLLPPTVADEVDKNFVPFLSKPQIDFDYVENNNYQPVTRVVAFVPAAKRRKDASFELDDEPECNQPAAKRKRTDDFVRQSQSINMTLLTSFKQRPILTPMRLPVADASAADVTPERDTDGACINLLTTPLVTSSRLITKGSPVRSERGRPQTPQSILKTRRTDTGSCSQSRRSVSPTLSTRSARRSVDFDDRSMRYQQRQLNLDVSEEGGPLTTIPESIDDNGSESNSSYTQRIKARPPIRSGGNSPASTSAEEFYSPNASKHSELEDALRAAAERSRSVSQRLSRSPSRGSTPEVDTPRQTRSKSRQLNMSDELEDDRPEELVFARVNASTPLHLPKSKTPSDTHKSPKKSLSRIAVETNARKLIERRMTDERSDEAAATTSTAAAAAAKSTESSFSSDFEDSWVQPPENVLVDYSLASPDTYNAYLATLESPQNVSDLSYADSSIEGIPSNQTHFLEDVVSPREAAWLKMVEEKERKEKEQNPGAAEEASNKSESPLSLLRRKYPQMFSNKEKNPNVLDEYMKEQRKKTSVQPANEPLIVQQEEQLQVSGIEPMETSQMEIDEPITVAEPQLEQQQEQQPEQKSEQESEPKPEPKPEQNPEPKPEQKPEQQPEPQPQHAVESSLPIENEPNDTVAAIQSSQPMAAIAQAPEAEPEETSVVIDISMSDDSYIPYPENVLEDLSQPTESFMERYNNRFESSLEQTADQSSYFQMESHYFEDEPSVMHPGLAAMNAATAAAANAIASTNTTDSANQVNSMCKPFIAHIS